MSDKRRHFGIGIENTMTASDSSQQDTNVVLVKESDQNDISGDSCGNLMEKPNGVESTAKSVISTSLAVEILSLVDHNTSNFEDLVEEIEDLLEAGFYIGEFVYHCGKKYEVKSKKKHGGLVMYTMTDGSSIGHREIRRSKELSIEYVKEYIKKNAIFDGKCWKVNDEAKKLYQLKEKLAPIFCKTKETSTLEESGEEDDEIKAVFQNRASGGIAANRKSLQAAQKKAETKKLKEKKAKEKEEKKKEKLKKTNEKKEKLKKTNENEEKKKEKLKKTNENGMEKFLKKGESSSAESAPIFSPNKMAEKRLISALNKMENYWNSRDLPAFNAISAECAKTITEKKIETIENKYFKFSILKYYNRNKDLSKIKRLKAEERQEYREQMAEERKELYASMEPVIRKHFSEEIEEEDLFVCADRLLLPCGSIEMESDEEFLKCVEITQFMTSVRTVLAFHGDISATQLKNDLHAGFEGYQRSVFKILQNLLETCVDEEEYNKVVFKNARVREYPINEYSITELLRALIIENVELTEKSKRQKENKEENKEENEEENEEEMEEEEELNIEDENVLEILRLFDSQEHIFNWKPMDVLKLMETMMMKVLNLSLIQEWYLTEATSDRRSELRDELAALNIKLENAKNELAAIPVRGGDLKEMTRLESRTWAAREKNRERLVGVVEDLKEESSRIAKEILEERYMQSRLFRTTVIGEDRNFRKYYWFENVDAGIWVQDFGVTEYEKWVVKMKKEGIESLDDEGVGVFSGSNCVKPVEKFYKIADVESITSLVNSLEGGRREKNLKRTLVKNMKEIIESLSSVNIEREELENRSVSPEETEGFGVVYPSIRKVMKRLVQDLDANNITMLIRKEFEMKLKDATNLNEIKTLIIELTKSILPSAIVFNHPYHFAHENKLFSKLKIGRFTKKIRNARSESALHALLGYLQSRITFIYNKKRVKRCDVCRKSSLPDAMLKCRQCASLSHYTCLRGNLTASVVEKPEFRESWLCNRCKNKNRLVNSNVALEDSEDGHEYRELRSRNAKRKANDAMREVFQNDTAKKPMNESPPLKEVKEMFDSVESKNPRLYKLLEMIEPLGRGTRASSGVLKLEEIGKNLGAYSSTEELKKDILDFLQMAKEYMIKHNSRKLEELETLISEIDL